MPGKYTPHGTVGATRGSLVPTPVFDADLTLQCLKAADTGVAAELTLAHTDIHGSRTSHLQRKRSTCSVNMVQWTENVVRDLPRPTGPFADSPSVSCIRYKETTWAALFFFCSMEAFYSVSSPLL